MKRRTLAALAVLSTPIALFACAQRDDVPRRRAAAAYPNPTVDALATTSGTSGTFVVPSGAYVTSWWAHAAAGGAGGTVTIAPSGPGSYATCYVSDAATCRDAGPAITIPAGVAFTLEIPTLKGGADELGAGSVFVFAGTDSFAITVNGPAGSAIVDAGVDSGPVDAGPGNMPLVLTPPEAFASGGTITNYVFANSGACGSGTPTVTVGGVAATGVTCTGTPGAGHWTNPANSVGNGGLNGSSASLSVVITTTGGACPSGCSSFGAQNGIYYLAQNVASLGWYRSDSFPTGPTTWGGDGGPWPDLSGNSVSLFANAGAGNSSSVTNLSVLNGLVAVQYRTSAGTATYAASTIGLDAGARSCPAGSAFSVANIICPTLSAAQQGWAGVATESTNPSPGTNVTATATAASGGSDYSTAATTGSNGTITSGSCYRNGYVANGASTFAITGSTVTTGTAGSTGTPTQLEIGGGGTLPLPTFYANGLVVEVLFTCHAVTQADLKQQLNAMQAVWQAGSTGSGATTIL